MENGYDNILNTNRMENYQDKQRYETENFGIQCKCKHEYSIFFKKKEEKEKYGRNDRFSMGSIMLLENTPEVEWMMRVEL